MGDHFYCTDPRGELAPQLGCEREGITACGRARKQTVTLGGLPPIPILELFDSPLGIKAALKGGSSARWRTQCDPRPTRHTGNR